ncbi:enolase N-terminal domain-like protein [Amanita rubescens]|nr:enolase N-terminal domain-like protein [Amanita rubescens]KAF8333739.1 enolase N-terminal domain-like protein [Amanita rubescens]
MGDGTDTTNTDCDYSAAYIMLFTDAAGFVGYGMTLTAGRGNDTVCRATKDLANRLKEANSSVQRIGSEKGAIHLAVASVDNALWDMYARSRKKPLQKLVVDMTPVRWFHSSSV